VAGIPRTGLLRRDTGATPGAKNQQDEKSHHGDFCSDAVQGAHGHAPAAGELGNELEASRRQNGNENASSNCKSVLQNRNSQIRPVTA
jgi:hypothetical protein